MGTNEVANPNMVVSPRLLTEVHNSVVLIRERPVIADADVAALYGVETKRVNEAVKNNPDKFPDDYMFELSSDENKLLRSKLSTTKSVFQKQNSHESIHGEGVVYARYNLEKQKRVGRDFRYNRDVHGGKRAKA